MNPLPAPTAIELNELRQDRSADFGPLPAVLAEPERGGLKSALLNSMAVLPELASARQAKVAADRTAPQTAKAAVNKRAGVVIDYIATIGGTLSGTTIF